MGRPTASTTPIAKLTKPFILLGIGLIVSTARAVGSAVSRL